MPTSSKLNFLVNTAYLVVCILIFYLALKYALPVLLPFLIAFALAAVLRRPVGFMTKKLKVKQSVSVIILTVLMFFAMGALLFLIGTTIVEWIISFAKYLPELIKNTSDQLNIMNQQSSSTWLDILPGNMGDSIVEFFNNLSDDLWATLMKTANTFSAELTSAANSLTSIIVGVPGILLRILITIIGTFFIGLDYDNVKRILLMLFPQKQHKKIRQIKSFVNDTVSKLLRTYAIIVVITFTELTIGLAIINFTCNKINYLVLIALGIAILDILPVLGTGAVVIPWAIINLSLGEIKMGIALLILYLTIMIVRNYLEPKLVGDTFGVSPIFMLLAIYCGGVLFSVLGVFLVPFTLIVVKRLHDSGIVNIIGRKEELKN